MAKDIQGEVNQVANRLEANEYMCERRMEDYGEKYVAECRMPNGDGVRIETIEGDH